MALKIGAAVMLSKHHLSSENFATKATKYARGSIRSSCMQSALVDHKSHNTLGFLIGYSKCTRRYLWLISRSSTMQCRYMRVLIDKWTVFAIIAAPHNYYCKRSARCDVEQFLDVDYRYIDVRWRWLGIAIFTSSRAPTLMSIDHCCTLLSYRFFNDEISHKYLSITKRLQVHQRGRVRVDLLTPTLFYHQKKILWSPFSAPTQFSPPYKSCSQQRIYV